MSGIAIEIVIDAPASFVWSEIADISTHTEWMQDAVDIRFETDQHTGVGTRFDCATKVGPFRLNDAMEITVWDPPHSMGVSHRGLVGGSGVFNLEPSGSATVFSWVEKLTFPIWFGGPVGAAVASPALRAIWRANLRRLKDQVEDSWAKKRREQ